VKTGAFVFGLCIGTFGAVGILMPSGPVWLARQFVTPGAFYALAAIRVTFGLILISIAAASRMPKALRVLGVVILIVGVTTALPGVVGVEQARSAIDRWLQQGLTAFFILALGSFIVYACAPVRHAATQSP
jgi:uncharacterized membrane protein YidH (DUF202 family)